MSQVFVVGSRPRLEIRIPGGRIDVDSGPAGAISIDVQGRGSDEIGVEQVGDTVTVRRNESGWVRSGSVRVIAMVPSGCEIGISVASADVDLRGELGPVSIKTASGDLRVDSVETLEVSSASGDLSAKTVYGDANVSCASGDVALGDVGGKLTIKLASGDLVVDRVGGSTRCGTASGDVRIRRCEGDEVSLHSVSGDAVVGFPAGTRLDADCTSLTGTIRFPEPSGVIVDGERRTVRFSGRSVSGGIRVERC